MKMKLLTILIISYVFCMECGKDLEPLIKDIEKIHDYTASILTRYNKLCPRIVAEAGTVKTPNTYDDHSKLIGFQKFVNKYKQPVIVAGPVLWLGHHPVHIRIVKITNTGFHYKLEEWKYKDIYHIATTFHYFVVEKGVYKLENGNHLEAGFVSTDHNWKYVNFAKPFTTKPVVLTQCQSYKGTDPVVTRTRNAKLKNRFQVKLQEEENQGPHVVEKIGYIALQPGRGVINDNVNWMCRVTRKAVTHNWYNIPFPSTTSTVNSIPRHVFIARVQTFFGADTCNLRYDKVTGYNGLKIKIEEEQSKDAEVQHTQEEVGFCMFSKPWAT